MVPANEFNMVRVCGGRKVTLAFDRKYYDLNGVAYNDLRNKAEQKMKKKN